MGKDAQCCQYSLRIPITVECELLSQHGERQGSDRRGSLTWDTQIREIGLGESFGLRKQMRESRQLYTACQQNAGSSSRFPPWFPIAAFSKGLIN